MPKNNGNLALKGLDELLFSTEEQRQEEKREQVQQIPIDELHPFTNHPFKVVDDEAMTRTVESIAQFGVLAPLIARPRPDGDGYEIISGHRRQFAAKMAGLETLPVIVRDMDDDAATILMVDSNLQREHISPSERAFAYKMKLDALKNQGARSDLTSRQVVGKLEAADVIGKATDESGRQVQRYVRLTNLIPELLNMVDEKMISFNPAVELSYLSPEQQQEMIKAMDDTQNAPSVSQAKRIKELAQKTVWVISPVGVPIPTQVPYEYKIFHTKLENKGLEVVIREELDADQRKRYEIFQDTLGGRPYLFNGGLPPGGSDGSGTPGIDYQVPAEALTDSEFAAIYKEAQKYVGTPYVWGGSTPETGFDCSGYVCWVYNQNGYDVGRTTANGLWNKSQHISEAEAKPGDLVFFKGTYDTPGMSHTGIYLGNGMMVSAGDPIKYANIHSSYWEKHLAGFGRLSK